MDASKVRMHVSTEGVWRMRDEGFKVYVADHQLERWAQVMKEFDVVQQEMFDAMNEEYGL